MKYLTSDTVDDSRREWDGAMEEVKGAGKIKNLREQVCSMG